MKINNVEGNKQVAPLVDETLRSYPDGIYEFSDTKEGSSFLVVKAIGSCYGCYESGHCFSDTKLDEWTGYFVKEITVTIGGSL